MCTFVNACSIVTKFNDTLLDGLLSSSILSIVPRGPALTTKVAQRMIDRLLRTARSTKICIDHTHGTDELLQFPWGEGGGGVGGEQIQG